MSSEGCRFCDIVAEDRDGQIVHADDVAVAFLDHAPLTAGHCLVVSRIHFATILDVPPSVLGGIFARVQTLSRAVMAAVAAEGVLVVSNTIVQQTVPHFHVHIVPRWRDDHVTGFIGPGAGNIERSHVAQEIRAALRHF